MLLIKNILYKTLIISLAKRTYKTHYQVLNLPPTCSSKEIKDAYIKLTKKYHPDSSGGKHTKQDFLQVAEAYKVLSKPDSRLNYDFTLGIKGNNVQHVYYNDDFIVRRPWMDKTAENFKNNESYQEAFASDSYYGIKGVRRISNLKVVLICLAFVSIGVGLQVLAISKSLTFKRSVLDEKSKIAGEALQSVRNTATENGNEMQIELLKRRFEGRFGR